ncbi:MAG: DUF4388 domain-containing protein [Thermoleophilia bacterium]
MGLSGDLRDFDLSEVLQILVMGKKTGVLELADPSNGGVYGQVWLRQGRVAHAKGRSGSVGVAALVDLLHTGEGRFSFETSLSHGSEVPVTIDRPLESLLLEASGSDQE